MAHSTPKIRPIIGAAAIAAVAASLAASVAGVAIAAEPSPAAVARQVHAVVHVDVEPSEVKNGVQMLKTFAKQAAQDSSVHHIEILQQTGAPNHFTILEVFESQAAYDKFVGEAYVKELRTRLQPILGGPFDERLHSLLVIAPVTD